MFELREFEGVQCWLEDRKVVLFKTKMLSKLPLALALKKGKTWPGNFAEAAGARRVPVLVETHRERGREGYKQGRDRA